MNIRLFSSLTTVTLAGCTLIAPSGLLKAPESSPSARQQSQTATPTQTPSTAPSIGQIGTIPPPSMSPTQSGAATASPSPTASANASATPTASPSATPTPTPTPSPSPSPSPSPTATPQPTPTPSPTPVLPPGTIIFRSLEQQPRSVTIDEESTFYEASLRVTKVEVVNPGKIADIYVKRLVLASESTGSISVINVTNDNSVLGRKLLMTRSNYILNTIISFNPYFESASSIFFDTDATIRITGIQTEPNNFYVSQFEIHAMSEPRSARLESTASIPSGPMITTRFMNVAKSALSPSGTTTTGTKTLGVIDFESLSPSVNQEIIGLTLAITSNLSNFSAKPSVYQVSTNQGLTSYYAPNIGKASSSVTFSGNNSVVLNAKGSDSLVVKADLNASVTGVPYTVSLVCYGYKLRRGTAVYDIVLDTPLTFNTLTVQ